MSTSVSKIVAERNHRILLELVLKPGNDICADCKARAPRWASYNLGIFICMNCASIHRKIGTHITKVKSITLDQWSKEQVEVMKEKGNIMSNALYNPNEARHPPPTNMMDSERDSELERFIRSKYEFKRFIDRKSGSTSQPVADRTASITSRPRSTPLTDSAQIERKTSPGPLPPPKTPQNLPPRLHLSTTIPPPRSVSQPLPPLTNSDKLTTALPLSQPVARQPTIQKPAGQVWEDLISLQEPSQSSSLPLQYSPMNPTAYFPSQPQIPVQQHPMMPGNAPNPFMNLSLGQANATTPLVASPISVSIPGPQLPFVPSVPLSSPALRFGMTNPFNQGPLLLSPATDVNGTAFSTSSNPFSSSPMIAPMAMPMPTTPSAQPIMTLSTGAPLPTSTLPYAPSQTSTPTVSFLPIPFAAPPAPATADLAQNSCTPVSAPGQIPLSASAATNPFSAMQVGQAGFPGTTPQTAFGTAAFLSQQQKQPLHPQQQQQLGPAHGFGGWAEQGAHGTF